MSRLLRLTFAFALLAAGLSAKIETTAFFNYAYNLATNNPTVTNSFGIDRFEIRFSGPLGKDFDAAARFDINTLSSTNGFLLSAGGPVSGFFPYLKEANVGWNLLALPDAGLRLVLGIQSTFSYTVQNSLWGHRYNGKVFIDDYAWINTFDLGFSAQGRFLSSNLIVNLGVYNGEGFKKPQLNNAFTFAGQLGLDLNVFKVYAHGDFTPLATSGNAIGGIGSGATNANQLTLATVVGLNIPFELVQSNKGSFRLGAEFNHVSGLNGRTNATTFAGNSYADTAISGYLAFAPVKQFEVFGRFDYALGSTDANRNAVSAWAGIQLAPVDPKQFAISLVYKLNKSLLNTNATTPSQTVGIDAVWALNLP